MDEIIDLDADPPEDPDTAEVVNATRMKPAVDPEVQHVTDGLTHRQRAFVDYFSTTSNASRAAVMAGYSPRSAAAIGAALIKHPVVIAALRRARDQRLNTLNISADRILNEMNALASSRIDHYIIDDVGNLSLAPGAPENAMAAVQSIKRRKSVREDPETGAITIRYDVELRLWDKPTPLRLMGRHVGLFSERTEITGPNGQPIETVTRIESVIIDPASPDRPLIDVSPVSGK